MKKRVQVVFKGSVQGVGFRFTAESIAKTFVVSGWVRNMHSGDVELVAEQEEDVLKEFLARLDEQFAGFIKDKEVVWGEASDEFKHFAIRF